MRFAQHGFEPLSHQFHIFGLSPEAKSSPAKGENAVGAGAAGTHQHIAMKVARTRIPILTFFAQKPELVRCSSIDVS